jgi:tetratricopeptide (TPR) repeat protein
MRWRYSMHLFASLADLWLVRGDLDKAHACVEQGLELATRTHSQKYVIKGWRLKGDIALRCRQWEEAAHWLRRALALAQTIDNPTQLWRTHVARGQLHAEAHQLELARQAYQTARPVIERLQDNLRDPELRTSLAHAPWMQQINAL